MTSGIWLLEYPLLFADQLIQNQPSWLVVSIVLILLGAWIINLVLPSVVEHYLKTMEPLDKIIPPQLRWVVDRLLLPRFLIHLVGSEKKLFFPGVISAAVAFLLLLVMRGGAPHPLPSPSPTSKPVVSPTPTLVPPSTPTLIPSPTPSVFDAEERKAQSLINQARLILNQSAVELDALRLRQARGELRNAEARVAQERNRSRVREALSLVDQTIQTGKRLGTAYYQRAVGLYYLSKFDESKQAAEMGLRFSPNDSDLIAIKEMAKTRGL